MSEFPSLTGATAHLILLTGSAQNPNCLLQLHENERKMAFYKFLGGYIDIAKQECIEDALRREIEEEAPGLANLLDLGNAQLRKAMWFTIMNYRKERKETCTFIVIWINDVERAPVEEYTHTQNNATLLEESHGETSGLVLMPLLEVLEETFSSEVNRRKLVFPYGLLDYLLVSLPSLDPHRFALIQQMMVEREAEKKNKASARC